VSQAAVAELQGRWEALSEELEAQRRRLVLAEATLNLVQSGQNEEAAPARTKRYQQGGRCVPGRRACRRSPRQVWGA
jgi:hypothetical protein